MRVCQFRHFGTVLTSGLNQIGSKIDFRKTPGPCQGAPSEVSIVPSDSAQFQCILRLLAIPSGC